MFLGSDTAAMDSGSSAKTLAFTSMDSESPCATGIKQHHATAIAAAR
jgi:hypothetical protein